MLPAFLTAILWSFGAVSAKRGADIVGGLHFNLVRLLLALLLLAAWSHSAGQGFAGVATGWFVFSGVIGFGLGDLAGYAAFARLGSRLAVLVIHCLAMPLGALIEWLWLGTVLTPAQLGWSALILAGLGIATWVPPAAALAERAHFGSGLALCGVAALSQALGAVTSRKAFALSALAGVRVDAGTAAYQRCAGGTLVVLMVALCLRSRPRPRAGSWRQALPWLVVHTLAGPVIGVACFQWALSTTPAGLVLPILATIPLLVTPLAWMLEGERPSRRSLAGTLLSVGAACALASAR